MRMGNVCHRLDEETMQRLEDAAEELTHRRQQGLPSAERLGIVPYGDQVTRSAVLRRCAQIGLDVVEMGVFGESRGPHHGRG